MDLVQLTLSSAWIVNVQLTFISICSIVIYFKIKVSKDCLICILKLKGRGLEDVIQKITWTRFKLEGS